MVVEFVSLPTVHSRVSPSCSGQEALNSDARAPTNPLHHGSRPAIVSIVLPRKTRELFFPRCASIDTQYSTISSRGHESAGSVLCTSVEYSVVLDEICSIDWNRPWRKIVCPSAVRVVRTNRMRLCCFPLHPRSLILVSPAFPTITRAHCWNKQREVRC